MSDTTTITIVLMAIISVVTRSFFFLSAKPWTLPDWAARGLEYAPVAALAAVIVPEVLMTAGHVATTWHNARLFGAAAGIAWYFWRRGVLGTIVVGMAVFLPLHLALGW